MKFRINPDLKENYAEFISYCRRLIEKLKGVDEETFISNVLFFREELKQASLKYLPTNKLELLLAKNIILDLVSQGSILDIDPDGIVIEFGNNRFDLIEEKSRIRKAHLIQRDQQLLEDSVREFIDKLETKRLTTTGWHSIFSVMRDGKDLAGKLNKIKADKEENRKDEKLMKIISPYIQIAEANKSCEYTGLNLLDMWRYFRHTWITPYRSLPGRSIAILIRDAASKNHPVIGIGALGSSVAQHSVRDKWIGWESESFIRNMLNKPSSKKAKLLLSILSNLISEIYIKDLIKDKIIKKTDLTHPDEDLIKKLRGIANKEIKKHRIFNDREVFNSFKKNKDQINWEEITKTSLFKSKRYRTLSILLSIRLTFNKYDFIKGTKKELTNALQHASFRKAIGQLGRKMKAKKVGINMMDIIICGAVAPYNILLGGKLVCYLLTSPEVVKYYHKKYKDTCSIIASSMKGERLTKKQHLVFLGTTSLYGVGSSQYNRVKIPANAVGGSKEEKIEYYNLGLSEGYGSFHFSKLTTNLIDNYVGRRSDGRRVNSIFGEGANPLMRKIREALDMLGFPSQKVLNHGFKRVVYGVPLASNFREILLGSEKMPRWIIPMKEDKIKTRKIAQYWIERWLSKRIYYPGIIEEVQKHTLSYPIIHGARVPPVQEKIEEYPLFK